MRVFESYKQAHESLDLPGSWQQGTIGSSATGVSSIKLTANPKSLDRISQDLRTIYYVGKGKKASPGEPKFQQKKQDQAMFYTSLKTKTPVHVLVKNKQGFVVFLGLYQVVSIRKVAGFKEIEYFQIKLLAVN
jgi:hypothetical protein